MRWRAMVVCALFAATCAVGCEASELEATAGDAALTTGPLDVSLDSADDTVGSPSPDLDIFADEASPPTDTSGDPLCQAGDGCFGEPCDGAEDCLSGICALHEGDRVCSKACDSSCPVGWSCQLVSGPGDGQYACVSNFSHLCLPCESAGECSGALPNACVRYADGLSFCGGACDAETPCPSGMSCQEVESTTGVFSFQCISNSGVCACSDHAISSALATPCEITSEHGVCSGVRACTQEGLAACSANEPAPESCNGLDDDCDGQIDENLCDDQNPCTVDSCPGEAGCEHTALDEGECLDGDACTIGDHCETGVCVGTTIDCDDENPCTENSCDGLGGCKTEPIVTVCDDGDACTLGDLCQDSVCVGTDTLSCDDQNPCTDDSCGADGCVHLPNALPCDDGNACSLGDTCSSGTCKPTEALTCDDQNPCTDDACDVETGCTVVDNAAPCDDGDACTLGDQCQAGSCAPGEAALICDDQNPCTDDTCGAEGCVHLPNALPCDDENACSVGDTCAAGACKATASIVCDDQNPCTHDGCDVTQGCNTTDNAAPCDDGNPCTLGDTCVAGACGAGLESLNCNDGNPCTDDSCSAEEGCHHGANAAPCDDGSVCTLGDVCAAGACAAGADALKCDDGNPCTDDVCDPEQGCVFTPNAGDCDDADPCTTVDSCVQGACVGTAPLECDDGVFCNGQEGCTVGVGCSAGIPPDANDGIPCTTDVCDETLKQVTHTPNDAPCNDDVFCNGVESCSPLNGCVAGESPALDDGIPCTNDLCDEATASVLHIPTDAVCDDGAFCNGAESCSPDLGCQPGDEPIIDDGFGCTADLCDETLDIVVHEPVDAECDNGDGCDGAETCDVTQGCVAGLPLNCDDGLPCTEDICDATDGCQVVLDDSKCDDGNPCTNNSCTADSGCTTASLVNGAPCQLPGLSGTCQFGQCESLCVGGSTTINYSADTEAFTVDNCATTVTIEAWGAQGGRRNAAQGGKGAYMKCSFTDLAGTQLFVRVGEKGHDALDNHSTNGGGGGGGSFVWKDNDTPLIIAGGGGGSSYQGNAGHVGLVSETGGGGGYSPAPIGQGGITNNGGGGGTGAGGGGWFAPGQSNSWANGGASKGGLGGTTGYAGQGGYGGGGASFHGGGGGGGYTGGSGGTYSVGGGGGGSYCSAQLVGSDSGVKNDDGEVVITWQ